MHKFANDIDSTYAFQYFGFLKECFIKLFLPTAVKCPSVQVNRLARTWFEARWDNNDALFNVLMHSLSLSLSFSSQTLFKCIFIINSKMSDYNMVEWVTKNTHTRIDSFNIPLSHSLVHLYLGRANSFSLTHTWSHSLFQTLVTYLSGLFHLQLHSTLSHVPVNAIVVFPTLPI